MVIRWLLSAISIALACSACSADRDLPAAYRSLAIPEARLNSDDARRRGERLYREHCALCHGVQLDGQGVRQTGFTQPPRNFTDGAWQRGITSRRMFFVIRTGVPGTAMPAWPIFGEDETWDLVAYVRGAAKGS